MFKISYKYLLTEICINMKLVVFLYLENVLIQNLFLQAGS